MDGDKVLAVKVSDAMHVQQAVDAGFPLKNILDTLHIDAMTARDAAVTEAANLRQQHAAAMDAAGKHIETLILSRGKARREAEALAKALAAAQRGTAKGDPDAAAKGGGTKT
jgi:hypothetical protein